MAWCYPTECWMLLAGWNHGPFQAAGWAPSCAPSSSSAKQMCLLHPSQGSASDTNTSLLDHWCILSTGVTWKLPPDSAFSRLCSEAERDFIFLWEFAPFLQKSGNTSSWVVLILYPREAVHLSIKPCDPSTAVQVLTHHFGMNPNHVSFSISYLLSQIQKTFTSPKEKHYLEISVIIYFKLTFLFQFSISNSAPKLLYQYNGTQMFPLVKTLPRTPLKNLSVSFPENMDFLQSLF